MHAVFVDCMSSSKRLSRRGDSARQFRYAGYLRQNARVVDQDTTRVIKHAAQFRRAIPLAFVFGWRTALWSLVLIFQKQWMPFGKQRPKNRIEDRDCQEAEGELTALFGSSDVRPVLVQQLTAQGEDRIE